MTIIDMLMRPELVQQAWDYFRNVQTKDQKLRAVHQPTRISRRRGSTPRFSTKHRDQMKKQYDPNQQDLSGGWASSTQPCARNKGNHEATKARRIHEKPFSCLRVFVVASVLMPRPDAPLDEVYDLFLSPSHPSSDRGPWSDEPAMAAMRAEVKLDARIVRDPRIVERAATARTDRLPP